ncbi:rhomboid family intramembrane serine protease [Exilibacterium tricleocarpae]|uniref:Rhomboid family intramembrane serine protease n=1 Tax=Exilibacterium tricleocarpae TaxID=2591008 RepID=A0A545TFI4_9GAMM|nr:rhomboid family intramembrane serine protease [Exilibacterium tricleocarpae]TQV75989.1 rhomboid family intramembrane serine protease [Exilibacterium tricleocarpae]
MNDLPLKFRVLTCILLLMAGVHILNMTNGFQFVGYGIRPRDISSLPNILSAPFLHGSVGHLLNNLIGLFVFSSLCFVRSIKSYLGCSLLIIVVGGLLVWLFGRPATHIGASGWVFGLWSLSIALAWFERHLVNIIIAVFVIFFYSGMIFGVLPGAAHVSFESHLFGAVAGVLCATLVAKRRRVKSLS